MRAPLAQRPGTTPDDSLRILRSWFFNSTPGASQEEPFAIATDESGNTYVTGRGTHLPSGCSYLTIKIDRLGRQQWVARYGHATPMTSHQSTGIVVDADGNVIVTGTSEGSTGGQDIATVKYSPQGTELWAVRYDGISGGDDEAVGIAMDTSGFIYVAGSTIGSSQSIDVVVLKYRPDGTQVWSAIHDGGAALRDETRAMAVTPEGTVLVAAESENSRGDDDYLTICFETTGNVRWAAAFDKGEGIDDWVSAICVDAWGFASVTGLSTNHTATSEVTTITYLPSGSQKWLSSPASPAYDGMFPNAIAAGLDRIVIVTGQDGGGGQGDMTTLAYDSLGALRWADTYDGPAHDYDGGRDIAISREGTIYVAGESRGTGAVWGAQDDFVVICYSPDGTRRWLQRYNGPADGYDEYVRCVLDFEGNLAVTGRSERANEDYDVTVVRYDSLGTQNWVSRFNGDGASSDWPTALTTDANGNICTLGSSAGLNDRHDGTANKFDHEGTLKWSNRIDHIPGGYDYFRLLAVDADGSVIACGESDAANSYYRDIVTIKYDSAGNRKWIRTYNSPADSWDYPIGMQVDHQGNIVVVGSTASYRHLVIKYDPDGNELWSSGSTLEGSAVLGPIGDNEGNIYSALRRYGSTGGLTILKHSAQGEILRATDYSVPQTWIYPSDLAIDRYGSVYLLTRVSSITSSEVVMSVTKFDAFGRLAWTATEGPPTGGGWTYTHRILIDEAGRCVIVGGGWSNPSVTMTLEAICFDSDGRRRWRSSTPMAGYPTILWTRTALNGTFEVVASDGNRDVHVLQYGNDGIAPAAHSLPSSAFRGYIGHAAINSEGELILAGYRGGPWWSTTMILTVGGVTLAPEPVLPIFSSPIRLQQNFPNPFNPSTLIHFTLSTPGHATVTVHNSLGQTVARLVDDHLPSGDHNVEWNASGVASGVYVIMARSGGGLESRKAVLVR